MTVMPPRDALWTGADAAAACGAQTPGGTGWVATGVSIDTRTLPTHLSHCLTKRNG